jgi:hypothetical protein
MEVTILAPHPLRDIRWMLGLAITLALLAGLAVPARAYRDQNGNRIDDSIDAVHAQGWNAAFVNDDPAQRMKIGVENPANVVFAVYVGYDHKPSTADRTALVTTGVTMVWPFVNISYIESRATYLQINAILSLPGVTRVEAVPVDYALNHYGSRVVRARDSRGLAASENFVLFPSVRTNLGLDGTGIVVAILDTGINDDVDQVNPGYPGHESLHGKFLGGGEFWCGQAVCATAVTASSNPQDHGSEASSYHASHVAGTALGSGGPGGFFAGVAPGARLVDCKVLSDAGASVGGSNRGLDWVIANRTRLWDGLPPGSIWQGIDVVSMSLGSPTDCTGGSGTSTGASSTLINTAVDAGLVVVIATGNDGSTECISSPAAADKSIAVGASEHYRTLDRSDDKVTTFSNEGPRDDDGDADHVDEMKPSVVAPGAGIISAFGDPNSDGTEYQQLSGTSMATPCVSGCVALVLQANPSLTPLQVRAILQNTAEHNVPSAKATGDRGQDPFGLDANYDPSCGWGLVDAYAACKEALNSTSGVQVVQVRAVADPGQGRIDFRWVTQREYPFQGFNVYRAPDVSGAPGSFTKLNAQLVAPTGHPNIEGVSNRTPYLLADTGPFTQGASYWYRVDWVDLGGVPHAEPPAEVTFGSFPRVATAHYQIVHNAADNDLTIRIGADLDYSIGTLGGASAEILGPGEIAQDSATVILPPTVPANTGTSTIGTIEHFWSVGIRQGDRLAGWLPPDAGSAWFLSVTDGGFVNRNGRLTAFSLFVNDSPGSASGTTYVTDHAPMPAPLVEGGLLPTTLWIPERPTTAVNAARFSGRPDAGGVRLEFELIQPDPGASAVVFRSTSEDFETRSAITTAPLSLAGGSLTFVDRDAAPGTTYWYWVQVRTGRGSTFMNGPVSVTPAASTAFTNFRSAQPNPLRQSTAVDFTVGADVAAGGPTRVTLAVRDVQGRIVRQLLAGPMPVGSYHVEWDATDRAGVRVRPGAYYLSVDAGAVHRTQKVTVLQ